METRGRALYNLIRMNWQEDSTLPVEEWQVADYREMPAEDLFDRLQEFGIVLDEKHLQAYGERVSSPEELIETIWTGDDLTHYDETYLLIFELWRRFLPENASLSIFCDQLDFLIDLYDQELLDDDEVLHDALGELERVLDEHTDQGEDPHAIFEEIALYCAHDLESFIYDFASGEIDYHHNVHATDIIESFSPYIKNENWFNFLEMRLVAESDLEEAHSMLAEILEGQKEDPEFEFLLEIARFLVNQGAASNFINTILQMRNLIQSEQDFQEVLAIAGQFYLLLEREEEAKKITSILKKRQDIPLEKEIAGNEKDVQEFFKLVEDLDRSEA